MVLLLKAIIVGASVLAGAASVYIFKMKHDNPIESSYAKASEDMEVAEEVIKQQTGIDVDLTPTSPEISKDLEDSKEQSDSNSKEQK